DDAEMADAERPAIGRLQFDKRVLADLHIDELHFALVVLGAERFRETERLGVIVDRLVEVGNDDADMVQRDDALVGAETALSNRRVDGNSADDQAGNEKSKTAHDDLPFLVRPKLRAHLIGVRISLEARNR